MLVRAARVALHALLLVLVLVLLLLLPAPAPLLLLCLLLLVLVLLSCLLPPLLELVLLPSQRGSCREAVVCVWGCMFDHLFALETGLLPYSSL